MSPSLALLTSLFLALVAAQTPGKNPETHPKLQTWKCTTKDGCKSQQTALVLDSASHPIYQAKNTKLGCGDWGNPPNKTVCPDEETCAKNCIMEGINNYADYGVTTEGGSVLMKMFGKNGVASPRIYLLAENEKKYEMIKLTGNELSFDVDVSKLPCGMNGALYFSEMEETGGQSKLNPGGAAYGTGYCDAQCFTTPWVNGVGNIKAQGICCNELDIWEANKKATQLAPHTCSKPGLYRCTGSECGATGVCDKNGCGNNPYSAGDKSYYGPGASMKVDTSKPFTVVTQFPAKDGVLQEVKRLYVQNGKVFENAAVNVTGPINDAYCSKNGATKFISEGGMKGMGESMSRGMVLAMSIWWDDGGFMHWLDSGNAGPCNATEGDPKVIQKIEPSPAVTFSQIKWGEIGSTYKAKKHYYS
ncbi:endoglucanase-like protein [Lindgomyces ingoldianus]|uniref:Endoglucanase-like protein n=1 Tax=Lindgomyces ingoldianus TaxID=673940 RepID=A0ACB6QK89_9PLEO|nr:endoglucanase-like protein [Lindgomyces ingoldianus]KAF2467310.1 endoglucanase-like protein [Lindgomyces ingoldianus]